MVGKKASRVVVKEEGLQRFDDQLNYFSTWPIANTINQKNYYTDYLKRDDQALVLRLQVEENRVRLARVARDRDRALAQSENAGVGASDLMLDVDVAEDTTDGAGDAETLGSKIIIMHPGSQNLRLGLASDALPKTIPMVVARRLKQSSSTVAVADDDEPTPKRRKVEDTSIAETDTLFGPEFASHFVALSTELKGRMRRKGRRIVPNSREVAVNYNRRSTPVTIPEHNDTQRIDWTDILTTPAEFYTGQAALRVPRISGPGPRYALSWPMRFGSFNEAAYTSKKDLLMDFTAIIEDSMKTQLGLTRRKDWNQYSCVFVVPDLYDKIYVTTMLELLFREFGFARVCFIQESLSGSFGAGYSTCVIVDVGAQKTSICCIDEGMCVEQSRINLKYGGADVTQTFMRMLLSNQFPYSDLNLAHSHDFLLAEELKSKFCTLQSTDVAVSSREFHLRVFGQNTRHYLFKTYDEVMLAALGYYKPEIFDHSTKLRNKHQLFGKSRDLYDGAPNNPISSAQVEVLTWSQKNYASLQENLGSTMSSSRAVSTNKEGPSVGARPLDGAGMNVSQDPLDAAENTESSRLSGLSPPAPSDKEAAIQEHDMDEETMDRTLPCMPLDQAIMLSIHHAAKGDERKMRDFFGGIIPIGGGAQLHGFNPLLEEELGEAQPRFRKELLVGPPPREIDPQVLVWKGASVFGKLQGTNDSWISATEYDRLGSRVLPYKCLWNW